MSERIGDLPRSWKFKVGLITAALEALSAVALLGTSAYLISFASEQPPILFLMVAVVGVRAFALGRAAFRYVQRLLLHDAVFSQLATLRPILFSKLAQQMPSAEFTGRGDRLDRFTSDVDELQNLGLRVLAPLLQAGTALLAGFLVLVFFFPFSSVAVLLLSACALGSIYALSRFAVRVSEANRTAKKALLRENLVEQLEQIELLSHLGWLSRYREQLAELEQDISRSEQRSAKASGLAAALLGLAAVVVAVISAILAPQSLESGTAGNLLAVAVLLPLAIFDVFANFQLAASALVRYVSSLNRVRDLVDRAPGPELMLEEGNKKLDRVTSLQLSNSQLKLGQKLVHENLNLTIKAGELVALRGESGSGKTTAALALSSLINPLKGELVINGEPARSFTLQSRRKAVLLIEQDPHVFAGTVRQNLEISGVSETRKLEDALERVGLAEQFANRGGLEALISEAAGNISGGQAQRLAIARGLLADASVLILDEPTSGLDWDNTKSLMELLGKLANSGVGVLVITHDAQLAELCDYSIWLGERFEK